MPDTQLRVALANTTGDFKRVSEELATLKTSHEQLSTQVLALKRNISCLYKTAKLEIDRKNDEIRRLREELESLQHPAPAPPS